MPLQFARRRDHGADTSIAQTSTDRSRGIRRVATDRVQSSAGTPDRARDAEPGQQRQQRGRVAGLARCDGDYQWELVPLESSSGRNTPTGEVPRWQRRDVPISRRKSSSEFLIAAGRTARLRERPGTEQLLPSVQDVMS